MNMQRHSHSSCDAAAPHLHPSLQLRCFTHADNRSQPVEAGRASDREMTRQDKRTRHRGARKALSARGLSAARRKTARVPRLPGIARHV